MTIETIEQETLQPTVTVDASTSPAPQPEQQPQPGLTIKAIEETTDPDELELREAKAAAEAENAPGQKPPAVPAAGAQPPTDQQQQPDPAAGKQPPVMIPKPRLDEALRIADEARQREAYWRGMAEARAGVQGAQPGQPQPATPPQPSTEDRLAAIATQIDELAKKFDEGEITMAEFKRQERDLQKQERELLAPAATAPAPGGDDLYLAEATDRLVTQHPWVAMFDQLGTDADWGYLKSQAISNLTAAGIDPTQGNIGRLELRKEIARLTDELGPALLTKRAQEKGVALPGQQQQPPAVPQPKPLSPQAQARAAKLDLQASAPPNLAAFTGAGTGNVPGDVSDAQLEAMTDDEIGALPEATRRRLLGTAA